MGSSYSRQWVVYIFRKLWEKANGKNGRPVAYELRHHYAMENINHSIVQGMADIFLAF